MNYIDWHYFTAWPAIILVWRNLILFPLYYFSVPLHLSTLLAPWKRQRIERKPGFRLNDFLTVLIFNATSRILGAFMRGGMIITGLIISLFIIILGLIPVVVWPVLLVFSLPFYLTKKKSLATDPLEILKEEAGNLKGLTLRLFGLPQGSWICRRLNMDPDYIKNTLSGEKSPTDFGSFINWLKSEKKATRISGLFEALSESFEPLKNILEKYGFTSDDVSGAAQWYELIEAAKPVPLYLDLKKIRSLPGIGADWAYGYTVEFDKYARDITKEPSPYPLLIGRDEDIDKIEQMLVRTENNNLFLIGEPGVARHMILKTLAYRMFTGLCLTQLSHKRVLMLDMHGILSAKPTLPEVKGFISRLLEEAEIAGNIIVAIDEIDRYVAVAEGRTDLADIIEKFIHSSLPFIGITTPHAYHRYIEPNVTLTKLFQTIEIVAPPLDVVKKELEIAIIPIIERKYSVYITYQALVRIMENAQHYLSSVPFPASAIELLDDVCIYCTTKLNTRTVLSNHVDDYLSDKFHTQIGKLKENEKQKLAHLEDLLHNRIINQENAIHTIASSLRRARLNIANPKRPIGSFLFLGPTGVGKTETAKALTDIYFANQTNLLRFDMSQYQKEEGLERLIGSVKTGLPGELTSQIKSRPFSLILLDEFEKADKEIYNLFLTLVDEGYITDSNGKRIDGRQTIIIATSNAGAEYIRQEVIKGTVNDDLTKGLIDYVQKKEIFSPEFINRFDAVVVFTPLSEGHMRDVAKKMLEDLNNRLAKEKISVEITAGLIARLLPVGMDREFGARAIRRLIAEKIEDTLAQKLLSGEVKRGQIVSIDL